MRPSLESRFEAYCDEWVGALSHADRSQPARWYLNEIARAQIEAAPQAGIPRGTVLGDAAYGDGTG